MNNWKSLPLSEVLQEARPGFACGEDPADGVFQFRMNNLTTDGQLDFSKKRRVPKDIRNLGTFFLKPGDVLFNATNSPDLVGKSAYFPGHSEPAVFSNHFLRLRPNKDKLDGQYLARWLTLQFQRRVFKNLCRQWVNQATVGRDLLLSLQVPTPSLPIQRRNAEILGKTDALRAKRRTTLAKLDTLFRSIFLDLFEDVVGRKWPMTTIADVADPTEGAIRTGPFGSQLLHSEFISSGIRVLGIDNVVSNEFRWGEPRFISEAKYRELKRYTVRPGDVLITIMGTCGRCAIVPNNIPVAINTKHLCCITLDQRKCLPGFLHAYFLQHPIAQRYLEQSAKGAIMSGLNMGIIKAMPVPLPPIELQRIFIERLGLVESTRTRYLDSQAEMNELFSSLQHRALQEEL